MTPDPALHSSVGLLIWDIVAVAACVFIAYVATFGNPFRRSVTKE